MSRRYVQEASRLAPKSSNGTYPVVIISEGTGSSGVYSGDLLTKSAEVFENAPSFINHPADPERPDLRDLNSIAGRLSNTRVGEDAGKTAILADFKPRAEYESLFEQYGDIIGLSIFWSAEGEADDTGRIVVESFTPNDPYGSVDAVVAAGRGGRFKKAAESLRTIESSLGIPQGTTPTATSADQEKEHNMDEVLKAIEALMKSLEPVVAFVTESKNAGEQKAQVEADAAAVETAVESALTAYDEKVVAIEAADLLDSQVEELRAEARLGKDVAPLIEKAKKVVAEARTAAGKSGFMYSEKIGDGESPDLSINLGGN